MFDIEYKGENSVVITTKKAKLVSNPKLSAVGLKDVKVDGSVVIATTPDMMVTSDEAMLKIDGPGEYEVADFSIKAVPADAYGAPKDSKAATMYRITVGDVRIALLGSIRPELTEAQLEALGVVDMVILPVGGGGTLNATEAAHLARAIEAKAVVPVYYADPAVKYSETQETLDTFKKEFGGEVEQMAKYKIKSASSLPAATTIIELSRS